MGAIVVILFIIVVIIIVAAVNSSKSSSSPQQRTTSTNNYSSYTTQTYNAQRSISSTLPSSHPAIMLYQLTRQCFSNEDIALVQMAKDIVRCAEKQQELSKKYKNKFDRFFIQYPDYPSRLTNYTVELNGYTYSLGFALELVMIGGSESARKRLASTNLRFQDRFGDSHFLGLFDIDEEYLEDLDIDDKEEIILNAVPKLVRQLEDKDLEFIDHIKNLLRELNTTWSKDYEEFQGYNLFDENESQYPAMAFYIDEYELNNNFKYNFANELYTAYRTYFRDIDTDVLRIYNIVDTIYCYIEMCTRFKTQMTILHGYYKLYISRLDSLNGDNIRTRLKNKFGNKHVEAIDKCLEVMCGSNK